MILDVIAFIALSVLCLIFAASALSQRKAKLALLEKYLASEIEKSIFSTKLSEVTLQSDTKKIEESEGFLKFISESRDWAFKYIEDVQESLSGFDRSVSESIEYLYNNRSNLSDDHSSAAIVVVDEEYKRLKDILPEDMVN
jgi:hypothetical protein